MITNTKALELLKIIDKYKDDNLKYLFIYTTSTMGGKKCF
jgi:hypothetical protein